MYPTNCPNCAAPLHNGRCEYCKTEVVGEVRFDEYIEFNLTGYDSAGNKYLIPVSGRISNLNMLSDTYSVTDILGNVIKQFIGQRNIEFTFEGAIRNEKN